jgi:transcriptional regulator with PAS, ATPase and Fis domain
MMAVYDQINRVASSTARVLVTGESGTGKELVARAIHDKSRRTNGPFIKVNCAALSESLLESELFGHEKGAFTGAHQRRLGRFELAHDGTLLLDEIGEMALDLQAKLLRVVQEGEIDRVGGMQPVRVDVRLICTTNRDLEQAVATGRFREDLYFRLSVVPITLPPLRKRKEDILALVDHFVELFAAQNGKTVNGVEPEVAEMFMNHSWPGNIRELENYIERAIVLTDTDMLGQDDFSFTWLAAGKRGSDPDSGSAVRVPVGATLAEAEHDIILKTLDSTDQNRTRAAAVLGISVRTLRNKLSQYAQEGSLETAG